MKSIGRKCKLLHLGSRIQPGKHVFQNWTCNDTGMKRVGGFKWLAFQKKKNGTWPIVIKVWGSECGMYGTLFPLLGSCRDWLYSTWHAKFICFSHGKWNMGLRLGQLSHGSDRENLEMFNIEANEFNKNTLITYPSSSPLHLIAAELSQSSVLCFPLFHLS